MVLKDTVIMITEVFARIDISLSFDERGFTP